MSDHAPNHPIVNTVQRLNNAYEDLTAGSVVLTRRPFSWVFNHGALQSEPFITVSDPEAVATVLENLGRKLVVTPARPAPAQVAFDFPDL